jgi:uncharacterized protein DUF3971
MSAKRDDVTDKVMPRSALGTWARRAVFVLMGLSFLLVVATGALLYRLRSGPLALPGAQATVTRLAQKALSDFDVRIGDVSLVAAQKGLTAQVQLTDLQLFTKSGQKVAEFPIMRAKLDLVQTLLQGIEIETIEIIGAEFRILRDMNGQYNILPPGEKNTGIIKPEMIFDAANIAARKAPLSSLRLIEMIDTNLVYIDQIKSRVWRTSKTFIKSEREGDVITAFADVVMSTEDRADTSVGLRFSYGLGNDFFGFGFKFDQASTIDLADQVPALDWLRGFDAAVTGSLNAEVKVDGILDKLSGVLETDKGQLRDSPEAEPVKFSNVKAYFEYAKETDSLDFTQITAKSAVGSVTGEGVVSLFRNPAGAVDALSGFVKLSELKIYPEGVFSQPLVFDSAKANVHMTLSPFSATLESGVLTKGAQRITMTGSSVAGDTYWNSSYFVQFNELSRDDILGYWPLAAKEKTRKWIDQNILAGVAKNGVGQLRTRNGRASVDLKFDIDQGQVRYLKTLPVLKGAVGRGHLTEKTFKAKLSSGYVIAPNGGRLDVFDSEFYVLDLTVKPAVGEVALNVRGGLPAALSVLDEKPFEYLKKSNLKPTLAHGLVRASGTLTVPLIKGTKPEDVQFSVQAEATNVTSKTLVKNRTVTADKVFVVADDTKVELTGEVMLDGLPTQTRWVLPIGKQYKKRSELTSDIVLNDANLRQFGVRFDKGTITGAAPARLKVDLQPKTAPRYSLSSNMVGMGLNISPLSWSKAKKSKGDLLVKGTLGDRFTIDSLSMKTAGLSATGTVKLNADNSFNRANFTSLTVGNWLNANVSITSTGPKRTKISVNSGSADLRNISFSKGAKTGAPMDVSLDRLILADGIVLTGLRAKLRNEQGLRGTYSARINGGAGITGSVFPQKNGTAAEINAVNAGEVLRSANLYTKGVGGDLRLVLVPLEKEGYYKGTFQIRKAKVKQDNILADMLNAISVIGLVQQLSGDGIVFELVDGEFTLKPQGVELRKTSAVGVSIGITLDGNYNSDTKNVKFEGVITPLYALNGTLERVFGKLFGRRKGEGLFSFVYNVSGPSGDPRITVNPFSILTPGVFREIFRTKMPDVGKADIPAVDNTVVPQAQSPQVNTQEPIPEDGSTTQEVDR